MKNLLLTLIAVSCCHLFAFGQCTTTVSNFPHTESFESGITWSPYTNTYSTTCPLAEDIWIRKSGSTSSSGTGPSGAQAGTYYVYTEASGSCSNDTYVIESPCYDLSGQSSASFSFHYHRFGSTLGTLNLEISDNNGATWTSLWPAQQSNSSNAWANVSVGLNAYVNQTIQLRFRGVTGSGWSSDMAIDNLSLTTGGSSGPSCNDGIQNQGETGVDCGGPCPACPPSGNDCVFWDGACGTNTSISRTGSIGLGTSNPTSNLHILDSSAPSFKLASSSTSVLEFGAATSTYDFSSFAVPGDKIIRILGPGSLIFSTTATSNTGKSFKFASESEIFMTIHDNGKIDMGTGDVPNGYKLAVKEGIITEKMKVALQGTGAWSDYVFEEDYDLKPLKEVEAFIKINKHLPGVPSAEKVVENGINVAEMDATLLKQIEELWLHVIDLKKENDALRAQVKAIDTSPQNPNH